MITTAYVRAMAAYNSQMNERIYAAAGRLGEAARKAPRGAFWGSIHGTLSHLHWADLAWMSRFDGGPMPVATLAESGTAYPDFDALLVLRKETDARVASWARDLSDDWLAQNQTWTSGAAGRELTAPRAILVMHLFNHQTHHRGQVHAMLTAAGETTGATDLPMILRSAMAHSN